MMVNGFRDGDHWPESPEGQKRQDRGGKNPLLVINDTCII